MRTRSLWPLAIALVCGSPAAHAADPAIIEEGKALVFDSTKGACLACHLIAEGAQAGNIAVPLLSMQQRFADKKVLRAHIWDQTQFRPDALMPPFGRHNILTEEEIDKIVEYIYTL